MEAPRPIYRHVSFWIAILVAVLYLYTLYTNRGNEPETAKSTYVSERVLGDKWPFHTVYAGTLKCINGQYVVMETELGTYAINGSAKTARVTESWKSSDEIQIKGKDMNSILSAASKLCN